MVPNKNFSCEGALIRRADVRFTQYLERRHGDLPFLGESDLARGGIERRRLGRLSVGLAAATTSGSGATTTSPTRRASSIPRSCCRTSAPEHLGDRATLWNTVEAGEVRKDAQLAREVEFAIPREMSEAQGIELARDFVQREFVDQGMVADLNVHWDIDANGLAKPHAHVMLSMREVDESGFGKKVRDWNKTERLKQWRERWADHVNERLASLDIDARIDHRSFEHQGIDLEPQHKIGPAGARRLDRGEDAERAEDHLRIARENGDRIIADPEIAIDAITRQQATFTNRDLAAFVHRHSDGKEQFDRALSAVRTSPELVPLGKDGQGRERFTSRDMIAVEARLERRRWRAVECSPARRHRAKPVRCAGSCREARTGPFRRAARRL